MRRDEAKARRRKAAPPHRIAAAAHSSALAQVCTAFPPFDPTTVTDAACCSLSDARRILLLTFHSSSSSPGCIFTHAHSIRSSSIRVEPIYSCLPRPTLTRVCLCTAAPLRLCVCPTGSLPLPTHHRCPSLCPAFPRPFIAPPLLLSQTQMSWLFSTPKKADTKSALSRDASSTGLQSLHDLPRTREGIVRTPIILPWESASAPPVAYTLDNVCTPSECRAMIAATEAAGYGKALINTGGGRQQLMEDVRNNTRCMIDDPTVAGIIFDRIREHLPQHWTESRFGAGSTHATLSCLNERLRFLKYTKGQKFASHYDGMYMRPASAANPIPERSYITVQLYLNDGQGEEFTGGSTAFIDPRADGWERSSSRRGGGGDNEEYTADEIVHCDPRAGRVLVFQHHLLHQGSPVESGTKYCLRTDAMYQPTMKGKGQVAPAGPAVAAAEESKENNSGAAAAASPASM